MSKQTVKEFVASIRDRKKPVGSVIRFNKNPHYIFEVQPDRLVLCTMDENKLFITLWG
jgi:hypothetical protein